MKALLLAALGCRYVLENTCVKKTKFLLVSRYVNRNDYFYFISSALFLIMFSLVFTFLLMCIND